MSENVRKVFVEQHLRTEAEGKQLFYDSPEDDGEDEGDEVEEMTTAMNIGFGPDTALGEIPATNPKSKNHHSKIKKRKKKRKS